MQFPCQRAQYELVRIVECSRKWPYGANMRAQLHSRSKCAEIGEIWQLSINIFNITANGVRVLLHISIKIGENSRNYAYLCCKQYIDDMDLMEIYDKDYHFGFNPIGDRPLNEVPVVFRTTEGLLRFTYEELLKLRKFFKKYGRDASFLDLESFDEDMFEENYDYLLDNLYSQLESLYPEDMLRDLDVSLEDYDIEWPQDLIADVLNDDFTDWDKLEAELEQAQREADEDMERFKREKNSEPTDIDLPF